MKWVKRIVIAVVVIVLLLLIVPVIALFTIDPNSFKPLITEQVQKATGRTLTIEGDLKLSILPRLGLNLGATRLSNAAGFGDEPFAQIDNVEVSISAWPPGPILKGQIEADQLRVSGLKLNLHTLKDGRTNWDDLSGDDLADAADDASSSKDSASNGGEDLALALEGIAIKDMSLHWRDDRDGTDVVIAPMNLSTGTIKPGKPFDLKFDMTAASSKPPADIQLALAAEVVADFEAQRYSLNSLELSMDGKTPDMPKLSAKLSAEVDADVAGKQYAVKSLKADINAQMKDSPALHAVLTANVNADLAAQTFLITPVNLDVDGLKASGQVAGTNILDNPAFTGSLKSSEFNLRDLITKFAPDALDTADPEVLKKATLDMAFSGTPKRVRLSPLNLKVDDTTLKGSAELGLGEKTAIAAVLEGDRMNLDRYLPPVEENKGKGSAKSSDKKDSAEEPLFPVDELRALDLDVKLKFADLIMNGIKMTGVNLALTAKDGLIRLTPANVQMFEGGMTSQVNLDVRGASPQLRIKTVLDRVKLGPLLSQLAGDEYLKGLGRVDIDLTSQGMVMDDIMRQLNGNISFDLSDGSIRDSELADKIETAIDFFKKGRQALKGELEPAQARSDAQKPDGEETKFTTLTGSAQIVQGVLQNQDLSLISDWILAQGIGKADLGGSTADYTLKVALNEDGKPKGGRYAPIRVKGPFDDLSYSLDLEALVRAEAEAQIEQRKDELKQKATEKIDEKLKDKLPEELREGLKGLFKGR